MTSKVMTLEDVRASAKERLKGVCNVYKDCDGDPSRFCQGQHYGRALGIGGTGSGASFHNNWLALRRISLRMQLVGEHVTPDTSYEFFGKTLTMPIMAAPVSGVDSFGGEGVITERDFCKAVVDGCNAAGTIGWRGDTHSYSVETAYGITAIQEGGQGGVKIVKPREQSEILAFFGKAEQCGVTAVGTDVDGCGSYRMTAFGKNVCRKTPAERVDMIAQAWDFAQTWIRAAVRAEKQDWDESAVQAEVSRRLLNATA